MQKPPSIGDARAGVRPTNMASLLSSSTPIWHDDLTTAQLLGTTRINSSSHSTSSLQQQQQLSSLFTMHIEKKLLLWSKQSLSLSFPFSFLMWRFWYTPNSSFLFSSLSLSLSLSLSTNWNPTIHKNRIDSSSKGARNGGTQCSSK